MSYKFIINPVDNKSYSIYSELGRELLKSYINQSGGSMGDEPEDVVEDEPEVVVEDEPEDVVEEKHDSVLNRINLSLGGGGIDYEYIQNILKFII